MNELELEELNSAIARYLPDRQLITFSTGMVILPKEKNGARGFANVRQISYFFHEWMHYLHNISTLHGVNAFVALAELWSAFRWTTDSLGISSGNICHASPELFQVEPLMQILAAARKSMAVQLPASAAPDNVTATSFVEHGALEDGGATHLNISVLIANEAGEQTGASIALGPGEILESVAFLLEKRFLARLAQQQVDQPRVVPYHVLTIFARYFAPSLTEEDVLLCGLASLQSTSPAPDLLVILKECESVEPDSDKRRRYLTNRVIKQMKMRESQYRASLDRLDAMFPYSKSMGRAVNETVAYMRRNLEMRKLRPFFELDFIDDMYSAGAHGFHALMDRLMANHGICAGRQEHIGSVDEIGRDLLFDFAVVAQDTELNEARRVMQASFDFCFQTFFT
ncbi:hypothetical protein [Paraburkholderia graminis]|uniref:hypothetical protein n=1 Tax=Paraburkholderia graminis TaxID=60548 RepID=UPI0038BACDF2